MELRIKSVVWDKKYQEYVQRWIDIKVTPEQAEVLKEVFTYDNERWSLGGYGTNAKDDESLERLNTILTNTKRFKMSNDIVLYDDDDVDVGGISFI